jgi:GMP reductase
MAGGMFSGHDESGGELLQKENGRWYKTFYGMSSSLAMEKHSGGVAEYRSSEGSSGSARSAIHRTTLSRLLAGKVTTVEYRGPVADTLKDILGGIRSTCTYVGASKLAHLSKRTTFIRVSMQLNTVFGTSDDGRPAKAPSSCAEENGGTQKKARLE